LSPDSVQWTPNQRSAERQTNATKVYEKVFGVFIVMMKSNILWKYVWNFKKINKLKLCV